MRGPVIAALVFGVGAGSALGQSFNLDFDVGIAGVWAGAADAYGGAAGQTGVWMPASIAASVTDLVGLDGLRTRVDLAVTGLQAGYFADVGGMSGDNDRLFGDGMTGTAGQPMVLTFTGLRPGVYTVVTYAAEPNAVDPTRVTVAGSVDGAQLVSGGMGSNALVGGVTHSVHRVASGGTIVVSTSDPDAGGAARVAGVQLVYHGGLRPRLYVNSAAPEGGDGSGWGSAIRTLRDALTVAEVGGAATEIWVARGTHTPRTVDDPLDRGATFRVLDGVEVFGGFAGTETDPSQRDLAANPTFLSGNIGQRASTDNVYHVLTAEGVSASAVVDGFIVVGGNADGGGLANDGGGLWINAASPRVRRCQFRGNSAAEGGAVAFFPAVSGARFSDCVFQSNETPTFGGAVLYRGASGSQVAFANCRFLGNTAGGYGGAVYSLNGPGWIDFVNCEFSGNESTNLLGGAVYAFGSQNDTRLHNCTVSGNRAASGGGVVNAGGTTTIANSILWGNTDTDAGTTVFEANLVHNGGGATAAYTDIQGMPGLWAGRGPGCFAADPLFGDADGADGVVGNTDDDLSLRPGSPCIDRGDNARIAPDWADLDGDGVTVEATPLDLAGRPRRADDPAAADLGAGVAPIVDLGAREVTPCPADFNDDGFLDFFDYDDYVNCFENGVCPPGKTADFNGDQFADFFDYDAYVQAFEVGC